MKNLFSPVAARSGWLGSLLLLGALLGFLPGSSAQAQIAIADWACVNKVDDFKYVVSGSNPSSLPGTVRLVDDAGHILYTKRSSDINFGQKFDISQLPDGKYKFLVTVGKETQSFALDLQTIPPRSLQPERLAQVSHESMSTDHSVAKAKMLRRHGERSKAMRTDKS
ncbi:hypothetical protein [Hymenobacter sp. B1770]|uniref:hypothetical protein n=1 Tax=Hymenobacter sp. B1770 TaxID=1718788 RepID=UPI003CEE0CEC